MNRSGSFALMVAVPPLVTLIIPTSDRPRLLRQSLLYACRQTHPNCEVIVVDDGKVPMGEQLSEWCPRSPVQYIRTEHVTIGRKRNLACWAGKGEYIAHWDDDDWYAPDRIERQVALLERTGKGITGTQVCRVYDVRERHAADMRVDGSVHGQSLLYRRELQTVHPFWDQDVGEDREFFHLNAGHRVVEEDWGLVVYVIHGRNITGPNRQFEWLPELVPIVEKQLGDDLSFYEAFRRDLAKYGVAAQGMLSSSAPGL